MIILIFLHRKKKGKKQWAADKSAGAKRRGTTSAALQLFNLSPELLEI